MKLKNNFFLLLNQNICCGYSKEPRVLIRILKIGVKMLFARKKLEFYHTFLLALLKKLESESKVGVK